MNEDVPFVIRSPGFDHQHSVRGIGTQPVGEGAARRSASDDDEVVARRHHPATLERPVSAGCGPSNVERHEEAMWLKK